MDLRETVARAIPDDLEDRRGIKSELRMVAHESPEIYEEIKQAIADAAIVAVLEGVRNKPLTRERLDRILHYAEAGENTFEIVANAWTAMIDALIAQHKGGTA